MLSINRLHASIAGKKILKGINLEIMPGEVHVLMGPNGAGKSTLGHILAGKPGYEINKGEVTFFKKKLLDLEPEERAHLGLFLAFQYPIAIPGVTTTNFLKEAVNQIRLARKQEPLNAVAFLKLLKEKQALVNIPQSLLSRSLNEGFSGGEKKRNEIFQMAMLEPKLSILDETDSGLDVDALKIVGQGIQALRTPEKSYLVITHYPRILTYLKADQVHILNGGKIIYSGDYSLANEIEAKGYDWLNNK